MNRLKVFMKSFSMLIVPALLLGLSVPVFAKNLSETTQQSQEQKTESQFERNIRHELVLLSNYTVFDNLSFQVENGNTVVLYGQVVQAQLKDDAEHAVKFVKGVDKVVNKIEILPLSPYDNTIRRNEFYAIYGQIGFERYAIQAIPPIHIIVNNRVVTLKGVVADQYDKNVVGVAANNVQDVLEVKNELRVVHDE